MNVVRQNNWNFDHFINANLLTKIVVFIFRKFSKILLDFFQYCFMININFPVLTWLIRFQNQFWLYQEENLLCAVFFGFIVFINMKLPIDGSANFNKFIISIAKFNCCFFWDANFCGILPPMIKIVKWNCLPFGRLVEFFYDIPNNLI